MQLYNSIPGKKLIIKNLKTKIIDSGTCSIPPEYRYDGAMNTSKKTISFLYGKLYKILLIFSLFVIRQLAKRMKVAKTLILKKVIPKYITDGNTIRFIKYKEIP
ncbi:hypothetical protein C3K47_17535 [Solitalea longa]|uniref:Uncharacterized protein n=1 Tax=Solitalea longa TaxID=2079460 RepID=A0A2S4ZX94_9SPHI|nr:hypothetical protein C3K47_17535 [Solitalea longa]